MTKKSNGHDISRWDWERYRTRLWDKFKLDEDTSINTRFTWEFRQWNDPAFLRQRTDLDEIIMDNFNLTMKHFLGLPTTAVIGRQDITLGQGWLVAEGTPAPLEGSRTFYFDAVRFTWDLAEKTTLDTIYIHNMPKSDWWLKPINDRDKYVTLEQENGAILYLTDKSNEKMQVEGYFIYKNNNPIEKPTVNNYLSPANMAAYSKKADIYTFGGALSGPVFNDNWNYRVEGAVQTGRSASPNAELTAPNQMERLLAFGEKSTLEYSFKDDLDNKVHVTYEYLSGDDPHTKQVESFNPLWGAVAAVERTLPAICNQYGRPPRIEHAPSRLRAQVQTGLLSGNSSPTGISSGPPKIPMRVMQNSPMTANSAETCSPPGLDIISQNNLAATSLPNISCRATIMQSSTMMTPCISTSPSRTHSKKTCLI